MIGYAIRIDRNLRRVWVLGQRVHHGMFGVILTVIGMGLMRHDRRDARDWMRFR